MQTRIVIATGGTGGHIFPAQALAQQLRQQGDVEVLFMGGGLSSSAFFDRATFAHQEVSSGTFTSKRPLSLIKSSWKILKGTLAAIRSLKRDRPAAVVGFGGFPCLPVLLAAFLLRIPIVQHEGNAVPGKVVRLFAPYARVTGLQIPAAANSLTGRCVEIPLPLRDGYTPLFGCRRKARESFSLDPEKFTLLVFGGSQGALNLNSTVCSAMSHHLSRRTKNFQVLHFTGDLNLCRELQREYDEAGVLACVKTFETRMDQAWLAADLVLSRAGASSIAEQIEFEIPGILFPYPHATDHHQERNARFMQEEVKGALNAGERTVDSEMLANLIVDLLGDDRKQLREMRENLHQHKTQHRTRDLCSLVCEVAEIKLR